MAAISRASLPDLKAQWRDLFGAQAPGINRAYLERRIAYKLQELAFGGLSEPTRAKLAALAKTAEKGSTPRTRMRSQDRPVAGTRLVRTWNGEEHSVTVLQTGFDYRGHSFASLTAVARRITGTQWNGPAFFGLRG
jgi:hypothetical protein